MLKIISGKYSIVLDGIANFFVIFAVNLVSDLPVHLYKSLKRGLTIKKVPYLNLPRKYGVSKTGTNLLELFKTGLHYVTSAVGARFHHTISIINS